MYRILARMDVVSRVFTANMNQPQAMVMLRVTLRSVCS